MKILHVGQMIGGLDVYIRNSIAYLNGPFDFVIVHGWGDKNEPIKRNGKSVREYRISLYRKLNPMRDLKCLFQTIHIIHKEKPDFIHCHSAKGGVIGRIAGFLCGVRTFYTPHAFSFLSSQSPMKQKIYLSLEQLCRFHSYLLACSESERQLGISMVHYSKDHALCWSNAVPDIRVGAKPISAEKYICYIGRPSYQKNPFFLVRVIDKVHRIHPEMKFYLLGVGYYSPDLNALKKEIADKGLTKTIQLLPWLSHEETLKYLKYSLFYLTVSRYEGLSLSVIEAMALGKAVVASDVLGNCDCVKDGYNGRLLPLNEEKFCQAIVSLIENNDMRYEFEKNSRTSFEKNFLIDHRIGELEKIYQNT